MRNNSGEMRPLNESTIHKYSKQLKNLENLSSWKTKGLRSKVIRDKQNYNCSDKICSENRKNEICSENGEDMEIPNNNQ